MNRKRTLSPMRAVRAAAAVTTALVMMAGVAAAQDGPADLIVTHAKVVTVDERRPSASSFAVRGGKFVAVGSKSDTDKLRGPNTRVVDAGGRTVIPGLNDSHLHVVRGGRFYNLELRWDGVTSLARALEMVREQAARTPKGQWVRVIGGWSPYQFKERRMPTVQELNEAAPDTPVLVLFLYSKGLMNRAGVQALKITRETKAPPGSRYELLDNGGAVLHCEPNPAILYGTVATLPSMTADEQANSTLQWYRELNRFGLTSAVDAGGGGHAYPGDYAAGESLAKQNKVDLRVSMYLFAQKAGTELQDYEKWTREVKLDSSLSPGRAHAYDYDGAGENLVAAAADFENFMADRPELPDAQLREQLKAVTTVLVRNNWPIRIHSTYDQSISKVLDVFEEVFRAENYKGRWFIDHAESISDRNLQRVKQLGGGIAIQNRMAFAGEYFVDRYGKAAASSAPPLRKMLASGVPLGAGTDATRVSSFNPWLSLYWMVSGKTVGGTELYPKDKRLTRAEALRLFTAGSAWFSGDEKIKGRIATGQLADFAVLSADYMTVPEEQIRGIESVLTVLGGEVVYAASPFASMGPAALPPALPSWSPVAHFGGYQSGKSAR